MITVARQMPAKTAGNAFLNLISSKEAIKDPVQAPVPGNGMPTKRSRPINSYFFIVSLFPIDFCSSRSIFGFSHRVRFSRSKIGVINNRINGTGIIFPITQRNTALIIGIFKSAAATRPPLSSRIGTMEMIKTIISFDTTPSRFVVNHVINASVILLFPFFLLF